MFFKLNARYPELELAGKQSPGRWRVVTPQRMEEEAGGRWRWWSSETQDANSGQRLALTLGLDGHVRSSLDGPRPVVIRTVKYRLDDLRSPDAIRRRRGMLEAQVELLNLLDSPLLPEPLDWLEVLNTVDRPFVPELAPSEPVLVLDWLPGDRLDWLIRRRDFYFPQKAGGRLVIDERTRRPKRSDEIDTPRVARVGRRLVSFLHLLAEKRVVGFDLNPQHVLLLKNDIPRFLGIGRLCPLRPGGEVDRTHPNYMQTSRGYVPPEVTDPGPGFDFPGARRATPVSVGAFSLGVMLLQMATGAADVPRQWLSAGTTLYPTPEAEELVRGQLRGTMLHELIARLCERDPARRLTDLNEIDEQLAAIARDSDAPRYTGRVKFYKADVGYGYVVCDDARIGEVRVRQSTIERSNLQVLWKDQRVSFEIRPRSGGGYEASSLQVLPPG